MSCSYLVFKGQSPWSAKIPEVKGPSEEFPNLKKNSKPDIICFFSSRSVVFVAPNKSALFHIFLIFDIRVKVRIFSDVIKNIVWNYYAKKKQYFLTFKRFRLASFFFSLSVCILKPKSYFSMSSLAPQNGKSSLRLQDNVR